MELEHADKVASITVVEYSSAAFNLLETALKRYKQKLERCEGLINVASEEITAQYELESSVL